MTAAAERIDVAEAVEFEVVHPVVAIAAHVVRAATEVSPAAAVSS